MRPTFEWILDAFREPFWDGFGASWGVLGGPSGGPFGSVLGSSFGSCRQGLSKSDLGAVSGPFREPRGGQEWQFCVGVVQFLAFPAFRLQARFGPPSGLLSGPIWCPFRPYEGVQNWVRKAIESCVENDSPKKAKSAPRGAPKGAQVGPQIGPRSAPDPPRDPPGTPFGTASAIPEASGAPRDPPGTPPGPPRDPPRTPPGPSLDPSGPPPGSSGTLLPGPLRDLPGIHCWPVQTCPGSCFPSPQSDHRKGPKPNTPNDQLSTLGWRDSRSEYNLD